MNRFAAAVFVSTILLAIPAAAADPGAGWYFAGKGGPSYSALSGVHATQAGNTANKGNSANVVGAFGMAGGYEWMYRYHVPLRTELEFMNRTEVTHDTSPLMRTGTSGALASTAQNVTAMAKVYWHFPVGSEKWWPFVSGGLGWSHNTLKSQYTASGGSATKTKTASDALAWSLGVGATLKMGPNMMNDIELRYVDLGAPDWGLSATQNIKADRLSATEVVFALRFMF